MLYASNSGFFQPGRRYRLTVTYDDQSETTAYATVALPEQRPPAGEVVNLRFLGVSRDLISIRDRTLPDGAADGVFELLLDLPENETVTNIEMHLVDEAGEAIFGQVWDTQPGDYWMIGVMKDGVFLNPADGEIQIPLTGKQRLGLYVSDSGYFQPGNRFRVTVTFSDGTKLAAYTII